MEIDLKDGIKLIKTNIIEPILNAALNSPKNHSSN